MHEQNTNTEPYFLADRIHARAAFVAELLKFYPLTPTEMDLMGMWSIMEDIAGDAKKVMQALDPANAIMDKGQPSRTIDLDQMGGHSPAKD
jgi:hypothetical protein